MGSFIPTKFVVDLVEEEQLQLETVEASVVDSDRVEFLVQGTITDVGSETLVPVQGEDVRPISVTFETIS